MSLIPHIHFEPLTIHVANFIFLDGRTWGFCEDMKDGQAVINRILDPNCDTDLLEKYSLHNRNKRLAADRAARRLAKRRRN